MTLQYIAGKRLNFDIYAEVSRQKNPHNTNRVVITKQDPLCDVEMSRLLCSRCGLITAVMLSVICCVCVGV